MSEPVEWNPDDSECQPLKCDKLGGHFWGRCSVCGVWSGTDEKCKSKEKDDE